ncbi:hypothetical protein ACIQ7D_24225 [Streptomyces sp. NPDC096310]|uniref:hypothetical protein n=1 Tax=Streptomyces sp. NPDC096310 TaxID=3366082 RepID=UPI0037FF1696
MSDSPAPLADPPLASDPVVGERATLLRAAWATRVALPFERVEVVVHPQSYVHSMTEFTDGRTPARAAPADPRGPEAISTERTHAEARP